MTNYNIDYKMELEACKGKAHMGRRVHQIINTIDDSRDIEIIIKDVPASLFNKKEVKA